MLLIFYFRLLKMLRQYNSLKNTKFTLSDFCTNQELEFFKKYLTSDGTPLEMVALTINGEVGPLEDHLRKDDQYSISLFEGRVMKTEVYRNDGEGFAENNLSEDLIPTAYIEDNERF